MNLFFQLVLTACIHRWGQEQWLVNPLGLDVFSPQQTGTPLFLAQMLHQSVFQSAAPHMNMTRYSNLLLGHFIPNLKLSISLHSGWEVWPRTWRFSFPPWKLVSHSQTTLAEVGNQHHQEDINCKMASPWVQSSRVKKRNTSMWEWRGERRAIFCYFIPTSRNSLLWLMSHMC